MSWGGKRHGAGRKPKLKPTATVLQHPSVPVLDGEPAESVGVPEDLSDEARAVWLRQAPHATSNRTLTPATALAFARYCSVVVLERNEAKSSGMGGANHRGLLKQINAYELQFLLAPAGKPMPDAPAVAVRDLDEEFFGTGSR